MPIKGSTNDITGDEIKSHTLTEQGRKNWDNIDWNARAREDNKKFYNNLTPEDFKKAATALDAAGVPTEDKVYIDEDGVLCSIQRL